MKLLILLFVFLMGLRAQSATIGPDKIIGDVKAFDEKTVKVENDSFLYEIPRSLILDKNISAGQKIELSVDKKSLKKIKIKKK